RYESDPVVSYFGFSRFARNRDRAQSKSTRLARAGKNCIMAPVYRLLCLWCGNCDAFLVSKPGWISNGGQVLGTFPRAQSRRLFLVPMYRHPACLKRQEEPPIRRSGTHWSFASIAIFHNRRPSCTVVDIPPYCDEELPQSCNRIC